MRGLVAEIRRSATPSAAMARKKKAVADEALELVKGEIAKYPEVVGAEAGGSFAKDTWLARDADIDIFFKFKKETPEARFLRASQKIGFDALDGYSPYVRYSQHPYVEAVVRGTKVNLVPCYDVRPGEWKSAADRSPFHTKFMKESLTPKLRGEVRVLKKFLQANGIYGAQIAREGFSGYVCEVLVLEFGGFEGLIRAVAGAQEGAVVGRTPRRFDTPVAIIDPVDPDRNLAAAVSDQNIGKFVMIARGLRDGPSKKFFARRRPRVSAGMWKNVLTVRFGFEHRSPEVIWGQLKRTASLLSTQLEGGGWDVLRSKAHTDERGQACIFFLLGSVEIAQIYRKTGPEFFREDAARRFAAKNLRGRELVWMGAQKRIVSAGRRRHTDAAAFVTEYLRTNRRAGIPKGLQKDLGRGFKVSVGAGGLGKSIKEEAAELISVDGTFLYLG